MNNMKIKIPANEWYGDAKVELEFPDDWMVHEQRMAGHDAPPLSLKKVADKLQQPIGSPALSTIAKGRKRCVIIIDDMTRPTKTWQMLPPVIDELHKGGITDDMISFVMATGTHGPRMLPEFIKKLGEDTIEKYCVFNHNTYDHFTEVGKTSYGTPVQINREVMNCDLKISITAMIPHGQFGFGGGAKILLPGVSSYESTCHNHLLREGLAARLDAEEAARMVNFDFIVNALINGNQDVSDIVCGDVVEAHREGCKRASRHYTTRIAENADISITNGYPMANEGYKAFKIARESVKEGGDVVFIIHSEEGARVHYRNGRWGTDYGGKGWRSDMYVRRPWKMKRVIVFSPHIMKAEMRYYGNDSIWFKTWNDALNTLKEANGPDTKVAIYPCGTMQISESEVEKALAKFNL